LGSSAGIQQLLGDKFGSGSGGNSPTSSAAVRRQFRWRLKNNSVAGREQVRQRLGVFGRMFGDNFGGDSPTSLAAFRLEIRQQFGDEFGGRLAISSGRARRQVRWRLGNFFGGRSAATSSLAIRSQVRRWIDSQFGCGSTTISATIRQGSSVVRRQVQRQLADVGGGRLKNGSASSSTAFRRQGRRLSDKFPRRCGDKCGVN
jgi:hypothetical protein